MRSLSRGDKPHKSHKDESDDQNVITVSHSTEKVTRTTSIHMHDEKTWKELPSCNANRGR
jgi:hypothetical protein